MQVIAAETAFQTPIEAAPTRLDALLHRSTDELSRLYAGATTPSIEEVEGDLRGRMLATTVLRGNAASLARAWAGSRFFPWLGKSFRPLAGDRGEGINRVFTDRLQLYRFETKVAPSFAGDFTSVELDYDLPENPFFIRAIRDEIRSMGNGLYLGQAYLVIRDRPRLVLYFGLAQR
jgi:hypothetical protein